MVAKLLMSKHGTAVYTITCFYLVILMGISHLTGSLSGFHAAYNEMYSAFKATGEMIAPNWPQITSAAVILCCALNIMRIFVNASFEIMGLYVSRGEKAEFKMLFSAFDFPVKVFIIAILQTIIVTIGFICFILPGFYLSYSFRMAYFVLVDDPSRSAVSCLTESFKIMNGKRMKIFALDLSFLPWMFISEIITTYFFPILDVWLLPYRAVSLAVFYNYFVSNEYSVRIMTPEQAKEEGAGIWSPMPTKKNDDKDDDRHDDEGDNK